MMRSRSWPILPLVLTLSGGCYGAKLLRQPIAVDKTEQRVLALSEQQAKLEKEIERLRSTLIRQEEMLRALRADTQTRLSELTQGVEEVGSRVEEEFERPDAFYPAKSWESDATERDPDGPYDPAGEGQNLTPEQIKDLYDNAYLELNRGNYQLALIGFRDYLASESKGELSDNAQYWIGECYYAQGEYRTALEEFARVGRDHPLGDKVPAALLKIAYSHLQLEERDEAREMLRDLINRFPTSNEATQARARIESLD